MQQRASYLRSPTRCGSASFCSMNPLRIPRPKIDKLACQAQGVGIFAVRRNNLPWCILQHIWFSCFLAFRILDRDHPGRIFCRPKTAYFKSLLKASILHHRAKEREFHRSRWFSYTITFSFICQEESFSFPNQFSFSKSARFLKTTASNLTNYKKSDIVNMYMLWRIAFFVWQHKNMTFCKNNELHGGIYLV